MLDGTVISSPYVSAAIPGGRAEISGSFNQASATQLANVLKYGALPLAFDVSSVDNVSAKLGGEQLEAGIIAGINLPIAQYPQITLPTIRVSAVYPGASAEVVEQALAQPIEEQVNGVERELREAQQRHHQAPQVSAQIAAYQLAPWAASARRTDNRQPWTS